MLKLVFESVNSRVFLSHLFALFFCVEEESKLRIGQFIDKRLSFSRPIVAGVIEILFSY